MCGDRADIKVNGKGRERECVMWVRWSSKKKEVKSGPLKMSNPFPKFSVATAGFPITLHPMRIPHWLHEYVPFLSPSLSISWLILGAAAGSCLVGLFRCRIREGREHSKVEQRGEERHG